MSTLRIFLALTLASLAGVTRVSADCGCAGPDDHVTVGFKQFAHFAGKITVKYYVAGSASPVATRSYTAGTVTFDGSEYVATSYSCGEVSDTVMIQTTVGQVITIDTSFNNDPSSPDYTEIDPSNTAVLDGASLPSASCLKHYYDAMGNGTYMQVIPGVEVLGFNNFTNHSISHFVTYGSSSDTTGAGSSSGLSCGLDQPHPDNPTFNDAGPLGSMCASSGAMAVAALAKPAAKMKAQIAHVPTTSTATTDNSAANGNSGNGNGNSGNAGGKNSSHHHTLIAHSRTSFPKRTIAADPFANGAAANASSHWQQYGKNHHPAGRGGPVNNPGLQEPSNPWHGPKANGTGPFHVGTNPTTGGSTITTTTSPNSHGPKPALQAALSNTTPGSVITSDIGAINLPIALGYQQGQLLYETPAIDANAYSPARLQLSSSSASTVVINDSTTGALRQIMLPQTFVDIETVSATSFQVRLYLPSQIGAFDGTLFPITDDTPFCVWTIDNPDAVAAGRVRFSQTRGGQTLVDLATWTPASGAGDSGTMTLSRHNDAESESRTYYVYSTSVRGERVKRWSGPSANPGPLASDTFDYYQEFYNWSSTGQIYEALVERVEDPDGAALDTQYVYYDSTVVAPGSLNGVIYPDGYWERYGRFSDGTIAVLYRPFVDNPAGPAYASYSNSLVLNVTKNDAPDGLSETEIDQETYLNQVITKHDEIYRQISNVYSETTLSYLQNSSTAYTQSQNIWTGLNGLLLQSYDTNGLFRSINYVDGYWLTGTQTFSQSDSTGIPAREAIETQGSVTNQSGVPNQSLIVVTVRDQSDRVLLEETYVNNGSVFAPGSRSDWISRRVYTYDSRGLLLSQTLNGNVVYEAGYDADGRTSYTVDDVGIRTEYTYDADGRVAQTVRKRGSSAPDQTTTFVYDAAGHLLSQTVLAAGLTSTTQYQYDLAGRQIQVTTPDGLSQQTSEVYYVDSNGNPAHREVTVTSPAGATTITEFYRDRELFYKHGTAVPTEYWGYSYYSNPYGFKGAYFYRQLSDQPKPMFFQMTDWRGDLVQQTTQNFGGAAPYNRIYTYNGGANADGSIRGLVSSLNSTGQAAIIFQYDEFGRRCGEGVDLDASGALEPAGSDPINFRTDTYELDATAGSWSHVLRDYRQVAAGSDSLVLRSEQRDQLTGLGSSVVASRIVRDAAGGQVRTTTTVDRSTCTRTVVIENLVASSNAQPQSAVEVGGLVRSLRRAEATADVTYTYDGLDRLTGINDPMTGQMTYTYNQFGQLTSSMDALSRTTTFTYFPSGGSGAGQIATEVDPAGAITYFAYTARNKILRQWGGSTYPVEYGYDDQSRVVTLRTYRTTDSAVDWTQPTWPANLPVTGDLTQWNYDYWSGVIASKVYADHTVVSYGYDSVLRVASRTNGRGQTVTYTYDAMSRPASVTYPTNTGTPNVTYVYDRAGRLTGIVDGAGTRTITYTGLDQLATETYGTGLLSGASVVRTYDGQNRLSAVSAVEGQNAIASEQYTYDALSRLSDIASTSSIGSALKFSYSYQAGANRIQSIAAWSNGAEIMATNRTYDSLGRLTEITTTNGAGSVLFSNRYSDFTLLDQRKTVQREDGRLWTYAYNARGEVINAQKSFPQSEGGQSLAGWQAAYSYDTIGNRLTSDAGGDPTGANLREASYTTNALNQYMQRTTPSSFFITGDASPTATVDATVNEQPVASVVREGANGAQSYYAAEFQGDNSTQGVYGVSRVRATPPGKSPTGSIGWFYLPQNPEAFTYDADGNLTSDDRWNYTWDAENRLVAIETRPDRLRPMGTLPYERRQRIEFSYDSQNRRVRMVTSTWSVATNSWVQRLDARYLFDEWNCLVEFEAQGASPMVTRTYAWGLDIANSLRTTGGVGGLLTQSTTGAVAGTYLYAYDGNGNVVGITNVGDGSISAEYDYSVFGETLKATGPMADINKYRFSTKCQDDAGLYYYGLRFYNPKIGRWINRDPSEESGGVNLYAFVENDAANDIDVLGLVLAAFDGTDNDRDRDKWGGKGNAPTNVAIMADLYRGKVLYKWGVGTRTDVTTGDLFGKGLGERVDALLADLKTYLKDNPNDPVDVIGFSRGAASARIFVNRVRTEIPCAKIRFVGLFDTVAQIGPPNRFNYQFGYNLRVDPNSVGFVAHAVAEDEHRKLFPLTSISDIYETFPGYVKKYSPDQIYEIIGPNYIEMPFAGVHSDIGGGYQDGRNVDALRWMIDEGQSAGAPFKNLEDYEFYNMLKDSTLGLHDSRYPIMDRVPWTHLGRKKRVVYPNP